MATTKPLIQLSEPIAVQLAQYQQRLSTVNGAPDGELEIDRTSSFFGAREDKDIVFVLPPGFRRFAFGSSIEKGGISAGGTVEWKNDNPLDATIHIHGWVDLFSKVKLRVFDVMGVIEE